MNLSRKYDEAVQSVSPSLRAVLSGVSEKVKSAVWEIRLIAGSPAMLFGADGVSFVSIVGRASAFCGASSYIVTKKDISDTFQCLCDYSVHSHESDIRSGFLTLSGGHRAGICGTAVTENGSIAGLRNISSIDLRIARENKTAAKELADTLYQKSLPSVIISGAPSSGKTTVLRDLARRLSGGACQKPRKVAVIDERGEIAAMRGGIPSFDMGFCCDVFSGYPKAQAIESAVRAMSPEIIICDELSGIRELAAVRQGFNSGVSFAVSIHAADKNDMLLRPVAREIIESGEFSYVVFLKNHGEPCRIEKIYGTDELLDEIRSSVPCGGSFYGGGVLHKGENVAESKTA